MSDSTLVVGSAMPSVRFFPTPSSCESCGVPPVLMVEKVCFAPYQKMLPIVCTGSTGIQDDDAFQ